MGKNRFARYRAQIRHNEVIVFGQKRTMRGVNYNRKEVRVPLVEHSPAEVKRALAEAVVQLDKVQELSLPL